MEATLKINSNEKNLKAKFTSIIKKKSIICQVESNDDNNNKNTKILQKLCLFPSRNQHKVKKMCQGSWTKIMLKIKIICVINTLT